MAAKKKPKKKPHLTPMHAAKKARRRRLAAGPKLANEPGPATITDPDPTTLLGGVM
jgi:hypothetical protein